MFQTYEEADELRLICAICDKPKQSIVEVLEHNMPRYYQLERCERPNCDLHCKGHAVEVQDIVHETWREPVTAP